MPKRTNSTCTPENKEQYWPADEDLPSSGDYDWYADEDEIAPEELELDW